MLGRVIGIEAVHDPPPGGVGVYWIAVAFTDHWSATFNRQFVVPPAVGQLWETTDPQPEPLESHPDGSPR